MRSSSSRVISSRYGVELGERGLCLGVLERAASLEVGRRMPVARKVCDDDNRLRWRGHTSAQPWRDRERYQGPLLAGIRPSLPPGRYFRMLARVAGESGIATPTAESGAAGSRLNGQETVERRVEKPDRSGREDHQAEGAIPPAAPRLRPAALAAPVRPTSLSMRWTLIPVRSPRPSCTKPTRATLSACRPRSKPRWRQLTALDAAPTHTRGAGGIDRR
jgi:hypothetical protein